MACLESRSVAHGTRIPREFGEFSLDDPPAQQPQPVVQVPEGSGKANPRRWIARLRLVHLLQRFPERPLWALFLFVNGFVTIGVLSVVAMLFQTPLVFPSLGPTAFLFFFSPLEATSRPKNALCGHALGILCGYAALRLTGLQYEPSVMEEGINPPRVLAGALAFAATSALMILCRVPHPPAGSTTLIVAFGMIKDPFHLCIIELAVGLMTLQAIVINRLAGLDYPIWSG